MTKIELRAGDKVIRADGLSGKITAVFDDRTDENSPIAQVKYESGETDGIWKLDEQADFNRFYLVGKTVFGNRLSLAVLDRRVFENAHELSDARKQLGDLKAKVERLTAKDKTLRKQHWRLETQMNGDFVPQNPKKEEDDD